MERRNIFLIIGIIAGACIIGGSIGGIAATSGQENKNNTFIMTYLLSTQSSAFTIKIICPVGWEGNYTVDGILTPISYCGVKQYNVTGRDLSLIVVMLGVGPMTVEVRADGALLFTNSTSVTGDPIECTVQSPWKNLELVAFLLLLS